MKGPEKILLIEENEKRRKYLARFFADEELPVQESSSFAEGVDRLLNSNDFAIALINGLPLESQNKNFLKNIKSSHPQMSIILMTSRENTKSALSLLKQNLVDHITTPDNVAAIFSAVNNEIRKKDEIEERIIQACQFDQREKEYIGIFSRVLYRLFPALWYRRHKGILSRFQM